MTGARQGALARLGLGTAQFGLPYGVTRTGDAPDEPKVHAILCKAEEAGVRLLDTAAAYGVAEQRIGRYLAGRAQDNVWQIVDKLPPTIDADSISGTVQRACRELSVPALHGMLFHRADGLLDQDGDRRWRSLTHEREAGRVARLGVSVYTPEELAAVRARFPIDIVQLPFSLLDRRFESQISGLEADGVEVHLRSVFLQGVLLTPPGHLPPFLGALGKAHKAFHALLAQARLSPITAALAVALQTPASRAIVGCQSESEFTEIADAAAQLEDLPRELRDRLSDPSWGQPSGLIDPRFWPA